VAIRSRPATGIDLFFGRLALDNHDKQDGEVLIEV
jgi:hypothetical protein